MPGTMAGLRARNGTTLAVLALLVAAMGGLTAVAPELYRVFCQVTGFGGTTRIAAAAPEAATERFITVRFNADVGRDIPWRFRPVQGAITLRVGETAMAYYSAENLSGRVVTGSAVFNVTPYKAGPYFSKIACFCFDAQTLAPGEVVEMPVRFFIDPAIMDDDDLDDVKTITLSYTFFRTADTPEPPEPPEPPEQVVESRLAVDAPGKAVN